MASWLLFPYPMRIRTGWWLTTLLLACSSGEVPPQPPELSDAEIRDQGTALPIDTGTVAPPEEDAGVPPSADAAAPPDAAAPMEDAGFRSDAGVNHACGAGEAACIDATRARRCVDTAEGRRWQDETCASGSGCLNGICGAGVCSDECHLGQTNSGRNCELYDMGSGSWVSSRPQDKLHDRARAFEKWIVKDTDSLLHEGIVSVRYTSAARTSVSSVYIGDTSLHTGLYLAGEAFRLASNGSARARKNVETLVDTIHVWFNISGDPGNLATIAAPAGDRKLRDWTDWDCAQPDRYCNVLYDGRRWDYVGDPSRDMYVGPILGLVAAYDALGEHGETHRARIRQDLVTFATELIRLRTINVRFKLNGASLPPRPMTTRFFIPEAGDLVDGAIEVTFSTSDLSGGTIRGGQEFLPNPALLFRQLNTLSWLPDIPRSSSAVMVAGFIRAAMHVSEGVPQYQAEYQMLRDFYYNNPDEWGNASSWIDLADNWSYDHECGEAYYGINIAVIPMYLWALLEDDPTTAARVRDDVLRDRMWDLVQSHKNPFFSYIYAGSRPGAPASVVDDANSQISGFPAPPRVRTAMDRRSQYSGRESGCSNQVSHSTAVDVRHRAVLYFTWHSNPWDLVDSGDTRQTYPGHDYLVAYWMGRAHGFLNDDTAGRCLRFR